MAAGVRLSSADGLKSPAMQPPEWIPTDEDLESYILSGRVKHLPKRKPKVVRIFLSSTFTDMYIERNALLKYVYPRLQMYCNTKYDMEFQVVDMRWGVRSTATNDHSGAKLCMTELKICQEESLGPNFVLLLGQRYGTRHIPPVIAVDEFAHLVTALISLDTPEVDVEFLHRWYLCDSNSSPPLRRLQPLDIMNVDQDEFANTEEPRLRHILRAAADWCLNEKLIDEKRHRTYFWSVTEEEVYNGILSATRPNDHCLCFTRDIKDINYMSDKVGRFVDMLDTGDVDKEAQDLLAAMKRRVYTVLDKENRIELPTVQWCDKGGTNEDFHADYLQAFCDAFFNKVVEMIDKAAGANSLTAKICDWSLLSETLEHGHQAKTKLETFQGRDDVLDKVKAYIENKEQVMPLTVFGDSGFGKTSIMAVASSKVFEWLNDPAEMLVIRRFLGTTPDSTNVELLLRSIASQARAHWNIRLPHINDPLAVLDVLFKCIPKQANLVLFLDSLDQLSAAGKAHTLTWLPVELPSNVKMIVSTLPEEHHLLSTIRARDYPDTLFAQVETLDSRTALELLVGWLSSKKKMLTPEQLEVVNAKFLVDSETSPLFVKLLFDLLKDIPSYMGIGHFRTLLSNFDSPRDCIKHIIRELRLKHGQCLVDTAFAFLHLSNQGLTENEIIHLLSLNDVVLNDVFQFHMPPLRRLPAVLWTRIRHDVSEYIVERDANGTKVLSWYHRQFLECGKAMFIKKCPADELKELRQIMTDYFMGVWAKGKLKPFRYTDAMVKKQQLSSSDGEADRFVPEQPNMLSNGKTNRRKFSQLPGLLVEAGKIDLFLSEIVGNIDSLTNMFEMYAWTELVPFLNQVGIGSFGDSLTKVAYWVLVKSLVLCCTTVYTCPGSLCPLLAGRMLPFYSVSALIDNVLDDIYSTGVQRNAFIVRHNQLEGLGDYLIFEIANQHIGPCYGLRLIDCYRDKYVFSVSKRAVLIDITAVGDIAMSYTPQLLDGDYFALISSADMLSPEFVAASLHLVPKVYVFSVRRRECTGSFDCRQVQNCEELLIQDMLVIQIDQQEVVAVWGSRCHGLLLFDLRHCELLYHYTNQDYIFSVLFQDHTLSIAHPGKVFRLRTAYEGKSLQVETVDMSSLPTPRNVSVTACKVAAEARVLATTDSKLFIWWNNEMSAKSVILDSPAHSLTVTDKGLVACTASSVYAIDKGQDGCPAVRWRILRRFDWAGHISNSEVAGYRLGSMSILKLSRDGDSVTAVVEDLSFMAHAKPITGILTGSSARMFLTSSADGSIRILDGNMALDRYVKSLSNFDRMEFSIDFVSGDGLYGLSVTKVNRIVAVWNLETGKITHRLRHDRADDLKDALVIGVSVVTADAQGNVFMWDLTTNDNHSPVWTRAIPGFVSIVAKSGMQLFILSTSAVLELSFRTGEIMLTRHRRRDTLLLAHSWIPEGVALLVDAEEPALELMADSEKTTGPVCLNGIGAFGSSITGIWYYQHILVLTFVHHVVFYNCVKNSVLTSLQLSKAVLMKSSRNVVGLRSGLGLNFFEINSGGGGAGVCKLGRLKLQSTKDMAVLSSDGLYCLVANLPKMLHLYRISDMAEIAVYACYSDIECIALTSDCQHALVGMTDTRLLCFLIVDHTCPDHKDRHKNILCKPSNLEELEIRKKTLIGAGRLASADITSETATELDDAYTGDLKHVNIDEFHFDADEDIKRTMDEAYATRISLGMWSRTPVYS